MTETYGRRPEAERGISAIEMLIVMVIGGLLIAASVPALDAAYARHRMSYGVLQIESLLRQVRIDAIKEKTRHRLLLHDENDATPNRVEIQREQGGSFVTRDAGAYDLADGVSIMDGVSTSAVTIGTRGECTAGSIYLSGKGGTTKKVAITSSCISYSE